MWYLLQFWRKSYKCFTTVSSDSRDAARCQISSLEPLCRVVTTIIGMVFTWLNTARVLAQVVQFLQSSLGQMMASIISQGFITYFVNGCPLKIWLTENNVNYLAWLVNCGERKWPQIVPHNQRGSRTIMSEVFSPLR